LSSFITEIPWLKDEDGHRSGDFLRSLALYWSGGLVVTSRSGTSRFHPSREARVELGAICLGRFFGLGPYALVQAFYL
jgi:hypothetical protein